MNSQPEEAVLAPMTAALARHPGGHHVPQLPPAHVVAGGSGA